MGPADRPRPVAPSPPAGPPRPASPADSPRAGLAAGRAWQEAPDELLGATEAPPVERSNRRRYALIAVAALVLGGLVAGLISIAGNGNDQVAAPSPSAGASDPSASTNNGRPPIDTPSPSSADPVPAGWQLYRDPSGYAVGIPANWVRTVSGASVMFEDPRSDRLIGIDRVPNTGVDPYDYWVARETGVAQRTAGYDFTRIARVMYRGWPTADFEYSAGRPSARTRVLLRNIVPDGPTAYVISWSTADRRWAADHKYFDIVVGTFALPR